MTHVSEAAAAERDTRIALPHLPALDGFRGLAILMVFTFHVGLFPLGSRGPVIELLGKVIRGGWIGVDLFFVLSGFLITRILLSTLDSPSYFRDFYWRRTLRIFPLYYGVLLMLALATPLMRFQWQGALKYYLLYVQNFHDRNWGMILKSPFAHVRLDHLWSLSIEEQFYLAWPALVYLAGRSRWWFALPLCPIVLCPLARIVALRSGIGYEPVYFWTPFRVDSLAWGALGAMAAERMETTAVDVLRRACLLCGGVLCMLVLIWRRGELNNFAPSVEKVFYSGLDALGLGVVLTLATPDHWLSQMFSAGWLRWFGRYSYGIYVFHVMLIGVGESLRDAVDRATGSRPLGAAALVLGTFVVTVTLAYVSYNLYERPFLRLKDRFAGKPRLVAA